MSPGESRGNCNRLERREGFLLPASLQRSSRALDPGVGLEAVGAELPAEAEIARNSLADEQVFENEGPDQAGRVQRPQSIGGGVYQPGDLAGLTWVLADC